MSTISERHNVASTGNGSGDAFGTRVFSRSQGGGFSLVRKPPPSRPVRQIQRFDGLAQLLPFVLEPLKRLRQATLAFGREPQMRDPAIRLRAFSRDESERLRASHELGHGALRELETLGQLGHRRLLAPVGRALDHQ